MEMEKEGIEQRFVAKAGARTLRSHEYSCASANHLALEAAQRRLPPA
jgi:hypothetical protein